MLNLRSVDYDFKRVWFSKEADTIRASIKAKECHCPLANASYTNMLMHAPTLAKVGSKVAGAKSRPASPLMTFFSIVSPVTDNEIAIPSPAKVRSPSRIG